MKGRTPVFGAHAPSYTMSPLRGYAIVLGVADGRLARDRRRTRVYGWMAADHRVRGVSLIVKRLSPDKSV